MKRFLGVLIASFFLASAAYAADVKDEGKAKDEVKVEKGEKAKEGKAKGKAKETKEGKAEGKAKETKEGKAKDGKAKDDAKTETK